MSTKQRELLQSQLNADQANKESFSDEKREHLIRKEQIENTPFWVVGNENTGYCLVFGKYKMTEYVPTRAEAYELLETQKWDILCKIVIGIINDKDMDWEEKNKIVKDIDNRI